MPLQPGIIYGPIASKRLGRSLGINFSGSKRKLCNYNCVYCFYGSTKGAPQPDEFPSVDEIENAVRGALQSEIPADWMTFSGNGEATTHPEFYEIVLRVIKQRDKYRPKLPIALLSNGSGVLDPKVLSAIRLIDLPVLKLDAGDNRTFLKVNRPLEKSIILEELIEELRRLSLTDRLTMQTVIFDGEPCNALGTPNSNWISAIKHIQPDKLQLYTLDHAIGSIRPINRSRMKQVSEELTKLRIQVDTFWEKK